MSEEKREKLEKTEKQNEEIENLGEAMLEENAKEYHIQLLTIIGEVDGHECLPTNSKTTKYEHILPSYAIHLLHHHHHLTDPGSSADSLYPAHQ